jgi:hypothetical protein
VLTGVIQNANLIMDVGSKWTATGDSSVVAACDIDAAQFDAPAGVTITVKGAEPADYQLASGGKLVVK